MKRLFTPIRLRALYLDVIAEQKTTAIVINRTSTPRPSVNVSNRDLKALDLVKAAVDDYQHVYGCMPSAITVSAFSFLELTLARVADYEGIPLRYEVGVHRVHCR